VQVFAGINTSGRLLVRKLTGRESKAENPLNRSDHGISFAGLSVRQCMDSSVEARLDIFYKPVVSDRSPCPRVMPDSLKHSLVLRIGKP
jgi:hypothetical protein